jgi:hypothetical protein
VIVICPSGNFLLPLSSPSAKNISLVPSGKSGALVRASWPTEGRAHVTNAGWDAVDADALNDEQR